MSFEVNMSLVGPRPHAPATEVEGRKFTDALPHYEKRHLVKPGLTGWAQVNGWRGPTPTLAALEHRLDHDLHYIDNWSFIFRSAHLVAHAWRAVSSRCLARRSETGRTARPSAS